MVMEYSRIILIIFSVIFGAAFGSFACCQAWRIRLREEGKKDPGKRSVCLNCGKKLAWYENIPIVSWLAQGGKCRKCGTVLVNKPEQGAVCPKCGWSRKSYTDREEKR